MMPPRYWEQVWMRGCWGNGWTSATRWHTSLTTKRNKHTSPIQRWPCLHECDETLAARYNVHNSTTQIGKTKNGAANFASQWADQDCFFNVRASMWHKSIQDCVDLPPFVNVAIVSQSNTTYLLQEIYAARCLVYKVARSSIIYVA